MTKKQGLGFVGIGLATLVLISASLSASLFDLGVSAADEEPTAQLPQSESEVRFDYPIMRPPLETRLRWIERYNMAPRVSISDEIRLQLERHAGGSVNLLDHLEYTPTERDQGSCGNCWAWAGTGVMEIALDVENGVKDRLSMQYLNSCESAVIGKTCCDGGWLYDVADFYADTGKAVPWSNSGAAWQDFDASCDTSCGSISTSPNYPIVSIQEETIPTHRRGEDTAIANIKNVLHQDKAVWFAFFLPQANHWDNFFAFWDSEPESTIWDPDFSCGKRWWNGGGHAVLCVGYNDAQGEENDYWIMLNSWGTASGNRPNGLFRVDMHMDYDCYHYDPWPVRYYSFYWQTLDIRFRDTAYPVEVSSNPPEGGTVSPASGDYCGVIAFAATANPGYEFVNWTINDLAGETANPVSLDIQQATTLVANFSAAPWTYTFEDPARGTELRVNTDEETFRFLAPDGYDSGIVDATEMTVSGDLLSGRGYTLAPLATFQFVALVNQDLCIGRAVVWQPTGPPWVKLYWIYDPSGVE